jgi:CRISPR-associated protein Cas5d
VTGIPGVDYQVRAHFEWNEHRPELEKDRVEGKHFAITKRMLERGGRQDIFLGTRDCQGYVEPCRFGDGPSAYDGEGKFDYGLTFHSFGYPDETGTNELYTNFWRPTLDDGHIRFLRPEQCPVKKLIRSMSSKQFGLDQNLRSVEAEEAGMEV